jgi:hypothetical protein
MHSGAGPKPVALQTWEKPKQASVLPILRELSIGSPAGRSPWVLPLRWPKPPQPLVPKNRGLLRSGAARYFDGQARFWFRPDPTRLEPEFQTSLRVSLECLSSKIPWLHNSFDSDAALPQRESTSEVPPSCKQPENRFRSGASPSEQPSPIRLWPKPSRFPVPCPQVVMLPLKLVAFTTSLSAGHRLRGFTPLEDSLSVVHR